MSNINGQETPPYRLDEVKSAAFFQNVLTITGVAAAVMVVGLFTVENKSFFSAYLHGWVWALNITLGALFWNMIHHVTAAGWSVGHRRLWENMTRALPVLFILSIPILMGLGSTYKWVGATDLKHGKDVWLSPTFFTIRLVFYFLIWISYAMLMRNLSLQMDQTSNPEERKAILRRLEWWAPSGVALLGLTATFAAFDWIMSLNYHWFSTIFGVIFWADGIRGSLAALVLLILGLRSAGYLKDTITNEHFHDMGKLTFGFSIFWAYVSFSQYFLYWYGNIPEETKFYVDRRYLMTSGGELEVSSWYTLSILLAICYFAVPFFTLLRRDCKRNPKILGFISAWILLFHCCHQYWEIVPESLKPTTHDFPNAGAAPTFLNVASVVMFAGILLSCTLYGLRKGPIIPIHDPRLHESLHHEVDEFGD